MISEQNKKILDLLVLLLSGVAAGLSIVDFFQRRANAKENKKSLAQINGKLEEVNQKL